MVRRGELDRPGVDRPVVGRAVLGRAVLGGRRLDRPELGERRLVLIDVALR